MSEERIHHPRSPSKLQFLEACPCYQSKEGKVHARATAGTLAHKVVDSGEDAANLGDDDALAAAECLDFVAQRREMLQQEADEAYDSRRNENRQGVISRQDFSVAEIKEQYLPIDDCEFSDAKSTTAGYIDHAFLSWDQSYGEIIDYKFGMWAVERADNNLQGIAYALGLFKKYPELQKVRVWFKQPHLDLLTDCLWTREQIPALYLRIKVITQRAYDAQQKDDFSTAAPHTPVCLFCENIGRCPVVINHALNVAKKFHPLAFPESIQPYELEDPKKGGLAMDFVAVMKVFCEGFRKRFTERVISGASELPAGFAIQRRDGARAISDMKKFETVTKKYLTDSEYQACLEASFGTVEEKISEKTPRGMKTNIIQQYRKELEESGAIARGQSFSFLRATG